jgi:hypothetical protein
MPPKAKRAMLYLRVSTDEQTVDNQRLALQREAERRGWQLQAEYADNGISGAKGRKDRPQLDAMLHDATRGKFDVVMVWALDRLGRSLRDLIDTLQELEAAKVDLFILQQAIDTTSPSGKLFYHMLGAFAEFGPGCGPDWQGRKRAARNPASQSAGPRRTAKPRQKSGSAWRIGWVSCIQPESLSLARAWCSASRRRWLSSTIHRRARRGLRFLVRGLQRFRFVAEEMRICRRLQCRRDLLFRCRQDGCNRRGDPANAIGGDE